VPQHASADDKTQTFYKGEGVVGFLPSLKNTVKNEPDKFHLFSGFERKAFVKVSTGSRYQFG
jgi:hypothetical protein